MDIKQGLKTAGKYVGKTAATIACPPLGLALWGKTLEGRAIGGFLGVMLSGAVSIGVLGFNGGAKQIYNQPEVARVTHWPESARNFGASFFSPLYFYFNKEKITSVDMGGEKAAYIKGHDAIEFKDGEYGLNFDETREFSNTLERGYESLEDARNEFSDFYGKLNTRLKEGDIQGARQARIELDGAKQDLEDLTAKYEEVEGTLQQAVENMNSELEELAIH